MSRGSGPEGATATGSQPDGETSDVQARAEEAWHALTVEETLARLEVDPDAGLSADEARGRFEEHGPNELQPDEPRGNLEIAIAQFRSPLIYILLVAAAVTIALDELADAAVIAAVLVINAVIGFIQERRAERSVHALMDLATPSSTVLRDGQEQEIDSRELVPGDVVQLTSGTRVPADLRLVATTKLSIDESLLTGESDPADKTTEPVEEDALAADRHDIAHMGSAVASGRGQGVVVTTGLDTELGSIAASIQEAERPETPLQQRMRRFANLIGAVVLATTGVAFFLGLALGEPASEMFLTAVALAVAVIPEGLPVAFTVAMALGVRRMARRNALIRALPAVETLGSTDVIGSDKTGTLTTNRMTVLRGWTTDGYIAFPRPDGDGAGGDGGATAHVGDDGEDLHDAATLLEDQDGGPLAATLRTGVLSNEASVEVDGEEIERRGDPTEAALLEAAWHLGLDPVEVREGARELAVVPFESDLRYSYLVVDEDGPVLRLKGAPERVLELCSDVATRDGTRDLDHDEVHAAAEELAAEGLRVLAMAERRLDGDADTIDRDDPPEPEELTLTGLVGMQDPPRPGVREAIDACRSAGVRVLMITGDHSVTAVAIARDLGIGDEDARVLTGKDVEGMDEAELGQEVLEVDVYARVAPDHKLRIVEAVRSHDRVVAVTGDGVNDAPALKAADLGVAMGRDGTDVAREASDMVLTDDNFVSIANAIEEGRVVFDNVRKVTYFLMSTGAAAIIAIIASIAFGLPLPYVPAALLWLNVVTNGLQDVALAFEQGEPDVLERAPRHRSEGIVSAVLWERTAILGAVMAAGSLWLFVWAIDSGLNEDEQRGVALTTLVIAMAVHVYNARSERRSIVVTNVRGNPFLLASTVVALTIHVAASYWGPTQSLLRIEPVTADGWLRIAAVAAAVVVTSELHKWLRSRRGASDAAAE